MCNSKPVRINLPAPGKYLFDFHVAHIESDLETAYSILGSESYKTNVDGLGDGEYWAYEFPCGLKLAYEVIHPFSEVLPFHINAYADLPEFQHALRHNAFPKSTVSTSSYGKDDVIWKGYSKMPEWKNVLEEIKSVQVWRQGDDGNPIPVGSPTSERDAICWIKELESHRHKQTYWKTNLNIQKT